MSLVNFRNMNRNAPSKGSPVAKQEMKLSFSQLATRQDPNVLPDKQLEKTEPKAHNGYDRKELYNKSSIYLIIT